VSFKIIMTTSVTRQCFTTSEQQNQDQEQEHSVQDQDQDRFFGPTGLIPKTDGLRPHHRCTLHWGQGNGAPSSRI